MKNILIALCIAAGFAAQAQTNTMPALKNPVRHGGEMNGRTATTGSTTAISVISRGNTADSLWWSKAVTVTNSANDTVIHKIPDCVNSVYTWCVASGLTGTNTSCVISLWGVGDPNNDSSAVQIYSVAATSGTNVYGQTISSGNGFPYSALWWVFDGAGTQTTQYKTGIKIK